MVEISTSVLSCKEDDIVNTLYNLETAKPDYFHIDVMDGEFVEENTHDLMLKYCEYLSHISQTPIEVHLMVKDVKNFIDGYKIFYPNQIIFHLEAIFEDSKIMEAISYIKENGMKVGVAINPATSLDRIYKYLPYIHTVLVMSVYPGKGGQPFIEETVDKIKELKQYIEKENLDLDIEVDGGINNVTAKKVIEAGANVLVSGSYITNSDNYKEAIDSLRQ